MGTIKLRDVKKNNSAAIPSGKMFSEKEVKLIGVKIAKKKNTPFFSPDQEEYMLAKVMQKIDGQLNSVLPPSIYSSMRNADAGISSEEAKSLKKTLNKYVSDNINISYLSILTEKAIVYRILDVVVNSMKKGNTLS